MLGSNTVGTLTFATAGPDTRTTQLFINTNDNSSLDSQGFAPFGLVVAGLDTVNAIVNPTPGNSNGVDQGSYTAEGDAWLQQNYPLINSIIKSTVSDAACPAK